MILQRVFYGVGAYSQELLNIPAGVHGGLWHVLRYGDRLAAGDLPGVQTGGGVPSRVVGIDWVYNSMPPVPQQIYPPLKVEAVREF